MYQQFYFLNLFCIYEHNAKTNLIVRRQRNGQEMVIYKKKYKKINYLIITWWVDVESVDPGERNQVRITEWTIINFLMGSLC